MIHLIMISAIALAIGIGYRTKINIGLLAIAFSYLIATTLTPTTDTTEFKYYELDTNGALKVRKLYSDPFMDLYNLEIISFSISPTPSAESILSVQQQSIENYIMYYNTKRIKERLNWLSPIDYRLATTAA